MVVGVVVGVVAAILSLTIGCSSEPDPPAGSMTMDLAIAPAVTIDTVSWTISNAAAGFSRTGSVAVRFSNVIAFQAGALPAASGYTIALSAASVDGAFSCSGSAGFSISAFAITPVGLQLNCSAMAPGQGTVVVTGTTQICATLTALEASPLETSVNAPIALSATGSAGTLPVSYSWTATAGTLDNPQSETPTFTCPATPGPVKISVTVSPSAPACSTVTSQSVTVTCSALAPTFTNVYTTIIGQRCIDCHHPGGVGVRVGMLDMSSQAVAFANLVGVNAQGTGAGTSGNTCASVTPALVRVVPGDPNSSLVFNKVHGKLAGTLAPCGSPMPLPAAAAALTQAEVDLISAWITAGAPNN
ncbi:MAG TPA: hypothetical protein VF516_06535 [Kofleriaceae bacterium]